MYPCWVDAFFIGGDKLARDARRDKAFEIYKAAEGNINLIEIAQELGAPPGTVRGWKSKDKWNDKMQQSVGCSNNAPERSGTKSERSNDTAEHPIKSREHSIRNLEHSRKITEGSIEEIERSTVQEDIVIVEHNNLNGQQQLFCLHYIRSFNATKSYQKAFNVSYNVAKSSAHRLLKKDYIQSAIKDLKEIRFSQALIDTDDILQKYVDIAFADVTDYMEFDSMEVRLKNSDTIDGTLITEVKQNKDGVSLKLADRMKALQWLSENITTEDNDSNSLGAAAKKMQERIDLEARKRIYSDE